MGKRPTFCLQKKPQSGGDVPPALSGFHVFKWLGCKGSGWMLPRAVTALVSVSVLSHVWFLAVTCSRSTDF